MDSVKFLFRRAAARLLRWQRDRRSCFWCFNLRDLPSALGYPLAVPEGPLNAPLSIFCRRCSVFSALCWSPSCLVPIFGAYRGIKRSST
jgi:hypothetical protein